MAKADAYKITNDAIEAKINAFEKAMEMLRIHYEQYFAGVEKSAPVSERMDVSRALRELEQINVSSTALKFRIRQAVQKFTSYATYWNRVLREIEDGTYTRHVAKAKRTQAAKDTKRMDKSPEQFAQDPVAQAESLERAQAVADEANAFLSSLGLGSSENTRPSVRDRIQHQNSALTQPNAQAMPQKFAMESPRLPNDAIASGNHKISVSPVAAQPDRNKQSPDSHRIMSQAQQTTSAVTRPAMNAAVAPTPRVVNAGNHPITTATTRPALEHAVPLQTKGIIPTTPAVAPRPAFNAPSATSARGIIQSPQVPETSMFARPANNASSALNDRLGHQAPNSSAYSVFAAPVSRDGSVQNEPKETRPKPAINPPANQTMGIGRQDQRSMLNAPATSNMGKTRPVINPPAGPNIPLQQRPLINPAVSPFGLPPKLPEDHNP